jgi:hypothetical protein
LQLACIKVKGIVKIVQENRGASRIRKSAGVYVGMPDGQSILVSHEKISIGESRDDESSAVGTSIVDSVWSEDLAPVDVIHLPQLLFFSKGKAEWWQMSKGFTV